MRLGLRFVSMIAAAILALPGCSSPCASACDAWSCSAIAWAGAKVQDNNRAECERECAANRESLCANNTDATKNRAVLDCVAATKCDSESQNAEAVLNCLKQCP